VSPEAPEARIQNSSGRCTGRQVADGSRGGLRSLSSKKYSAPSNPRRGSPPSAPSTGRTPRPRRLLTPLPRPVPLRPAPLRPPRSTRRQPAAFRVPPAGGLTLRRIRALFRLGAVGRGVVLAGTRSGLRSIRAAWVHPNRGSDHRLVRSEVRHSFANGEGTERVEEVEAPALMGPGDWGAVPVAARELLAVKVGPERLVRTPPVHRGRGPP